jgi:hypothetical protein
MRKALMRDYPNDAEETRRFFFAPAGSYILEAFYNENSYDSGSESTFGKIMTSRLPYPLSLAHTRRALPQSDFEEWTAFSSFVRVKETASNAYIDDFTIREEVFFDSEDMSLVLRYPPVTSESGLSRERTYSFVLDADAAGFQKTADAGEFLVGFGETRDLDVLLFQKNLDEKGRQTADSYVELQALRYSVFDYTVLDAYRREILRGDEDNTDSFAETQTRVRLSYYSRGGETIIQPYFVKTLRRKFEGWHSEISDAEVVFWTCEISGGTNARYYNFPVFHLVPLEFEIVPMIDGREFLLNTPPYTDTVRIFVSNVSSVTASGGFATGAPDVRIRFLPNTKCDIYFNVTSFHFLAPDGPPLSRNLVARNVLFDHSMIDMNGKLRIEFELL